MRSAKLTQFSCHNATQRNLFHNFLMLDCTHVPRCPWWRRHLCCYCSVIISKMLAFSSVDHQEFQNSEWMTMKRTAVKRGTWSWLSRSSTTSTSYCLPLVNILASQANQTSLKIWPPSSLQDHLASILSTPWTPLWDYSRRRGMVISNRSEKDWFCV